MEAPCGKCEKKGCGAYHDQCEAFQEHKRKVEEINENRRKFKDIKRSGRKKWARTPEHSPIKMSRR